MVRCHVDVARHELADADAEELVGVAADGAEDGDLGKEDVAHTFIYPKRRKF